MATSTGTSGPSTSSGGPATGASGASGATEGTLRWVRGREGNTLQEKGSGGWVDVPTVEPDAEKPPESGSSGASGA